MSVQPKILLVDMDDTIENLTEVWIHYANTRFGTQVDPKNVESWDPSEAFPEISHQKIYDLLIEDALYQDIVPLPGAVKILKKLYDEGYNIYIVTNTPYQVVKYKLEHVLFRYFPFIDWDHVILTKHKQLLKGDILIDDAPHNLIGGSYEKILFTAAHNRKYDAKAHGMIRVTSWEEIYDIIHRL